MDQKPTKKYGVDTRGISIIESKTEKNTVNIISHSTNGYPHFLTYQYESANLNIGETEIPFYLLDEYDVFHFGSYSISNSCDSVYKCIEYAKRQGKKIFYDVNYRPNLWREIRDAETCIREFVDLSDLIKMNSEELQLYIGSSSPTADCVEMLKSIDGKKLFFITDGERGSYVVTNGWSEFIPSSPAKAIDVVGAGDAYYAATLFYNNFDRFERNTLVLNARKANQLAALSTTYNGTICAFEKACQIIMI